MYKVLGYGEDSLTLWALRKHTAKILNRFRDKTPPKNCLIFYRPSFGRQRKRSGEATFGEFDAVVASAEKVYLVESKWDGFGRPKRYKTALRREQRLRHEIFSWYLQRWRKKYTGEWQRFREERQALFQKEFKRREMAPTGSLLARNLESVLARIGMGRKNPLSRATIKNVMVFFHNGGRKPRRIRAPKGFSLIPIDYSGETEDNFVILFTEQRQPQLIKQAVRRR
jgi:hypothetical protein